MCDHLSLSTEGNPKGNAWLLTHNFNYHFDNIDLNHATNHEFFQFKMETFTPEFCSAFFFKQRMLGGPENPDDIFFFNNSVLNFDPRTWELFTEECLKLRKTEYNYITELELFKAGVLATQIAYLEHTMPAIPCSRGKKDPNDPLVILHKKRKKENSDIKRHPGYTCHIAGASNPVFRVWDTERCKTRYLAKVPLTNWDRQQFDDPKEMKTHCGWLPALSKATNWDWQRQVLVVDQFPIMVLDVDQKFEVVEKAIKKDKLWKWANDKEILITKSFSGNAHIILRINMSGMTDAISVAPENKAKVSPQEWPQYYKYTKRYNLLQIYRAGLALSLKLDTGIEVDEVCLRNEAIAYRPSELAKVNEFFSGKKPTLVLLRELPEPQVELVKQEAIQTEKLVDYRAERIEGFIREFRKFLDFKIVSIDEVMEHVDDCLETKAGKREYYQKALDILDLNYDRVVSHWKEHLDNLWPMRAKTTSIGLAKAEFNEKYLGLPTEKYSTYFRQIFCYMTSLALESDYIKGRKTKDYKTLNIPNKMFFSEELLNVSWREYQGHSQFASITSKQLASLLGNGNTFTTLTRCVAPIMMQYGQSGARKLIDEAIRMSEANDKESRVNFVDKKICWLIKNCKSMGNANVSIHRQENSSLCGQGPGECDISSSGLQYNQCSSGEGSGPEGIRQSIRCSVLQTCVYGDSKTQKDRQTFSSSEPFFEQAEILRPDLFELPTSKLKLKPRSPSSG
jgi:hypothetical protein